VARRQQTKIPQKTWAISILSSPNHGRQYHMGSGGISRLSKNNTTWVLKESPGFSKDILASSVSTRL